mmetsp:Transcript_6408/g.14482  ORF Transcript_6408/g.14482 Transcript_6408/m.14482 type:complete len:267 (+) Transcript_6408:22-822(+)
MQSYSTFLIIYTLQNYWLNTRSSISSSSHRLDDGTIAAVLALPEGRDLNLVSAAIFVKDCTRTNDPVADGPALAPREADPHLGQVASTLANEGRHALVPIRSQKIVPHDGRADRFPDHGRGVDEQSECGTEVVELGEAGARPVLVPLVLPEGMSALDVRPLVGHFGRDGGEGGQVELFSGTIRRPRTVESIRPQSMDRQLSLPALLKVPAAGKVPPPLFPAEFGLEGHGVHVEVVGTRVALVVLVAGVFIPVSAVAVVAVPQTQRP